MVTQALIVLLSFFHMEPEMNALVSDLFIEIIPAAGDDFGAEAAHHLIMPG